MLSVCIRCGHLKNGPIAKCPTCQFQPQTEEDKARSLILSLDYEIDNEYRGKSKEELTLIGSRLGHGHPHEFDEAEVKMVVEYARRVLGVPGKRLALDGLRWLLPPIIILVVIFLVLSSTK